MTETIEAKEKVYEILEKFSTAMFVTLGPAGPEARPMHVAKVEDVSGEVWFFTGKGGTLAGEVRQETTVLLAFQNDNTAYLSLRGRARVVADKAKIQQLWKEPYKVWFPGGVDDPNVTLVAVEATDAEYWDNSGANKVEYLFKAAKAYIKGETPDLGGTDHHAKTTL